MTTTSSSPPTTSASCSIDGDWTSWSTGLLLCLTRSFDSAAPGSSAKRAYGEYDGCSTKQVFDNLHGNISLDPLACEFVDTEEFHRLWDLKQLGLTYLVYPGAVHTRFEHSLGVYQLAGEAMNNLKMNQGKELGIDRFDVQTVKLPGLLHDIGHGPFSHLFEHEFMPRVDPGATSNAQTRDCQAADDIAWSRL